MTTFILLSAAQRNAVRGSSPTDPECVLEPRALTDGRYILNVLVLADPAHAAHKALLSGLPTVDADSIAALLPPAVE